MHEEQKAACTLHGRKINLQLPGLLEALVGLAEVLDLPEPQLGLAAPQLRQPLPGLAWGLAPCIPKAQHTASITATSLWCLAAHFYLH